MKTLYLILYVIAAGCFALAAFTAAWHNELLPATGGDAYRVAHGGKMRGNRIGPG